MTRKTPFLAIAIVVASAGAAAADTVGATRQLAGDGSFAPGVLRARGDGANLVVASTAWSGAADAIAVDALADARVWGPARLVATVTDAFGAAKPGIGAAIQLLDEAHHGLAGTVYARYKAEGFSEPDGELELTFAFGKTVGAVHAAADVAYGQDPEGNERDAELVVLGQVEPRPGILAGATARYRDALGTTGEAIARDGFAGGVATLVIGHLALTGMAGIAMVEPHAGRRTYGEAATLAIGVAF